jgi:RNA polymerase sigma factor (TIGR02999 family)
MDATDTLMAHAAGDPAAADQLLPLVYRELRALAAAYMRRERPGHTLQPTALVHEAFIRLVDESRINWRGRTHFFALAARQMRRILIDSARSRNARKRGGGLHRVTLDEGLLTSAGPTFDVLALDEALRRLARLNDRQAQVVELRFFGGLSVEETAQFLGVSAPTVKNDWRAARAWLLRELRPGEGE